MALLPLIVAAMIFLLYLICERLAMSRQRNAIPLRISVTGTRGKSSLVRIIASILREDGRKVVAKTTGSQARLILLDAQETEVTRRGVTSIIEQKRLLKKAAELGADCLVAEIMSIHPENHYVESQQMLQPHIVVITNVRQDHTEAMGETKEEIAAVLSLDIPASARVFVPEKENWSSFDAAVRSAAGRLITVQEGTSSPLLHDAPELQQKEFPGNLDLAYALGRYLRIDHEVIVNGIRRAKHDIGKLRIWKHHSAATLKTHYFVNGFAANDPESTLQVIATVKAILPSVSDKLIGLLSLRADRGDRTVQWLDTLRRGRYDGFSRIYVTGAHSRIVRRKLNAAMADRSAAFPIMGMQSAPPALKPVSIVKSRQPEMMMKALLDETEDQSVIFGFGNMKGTGELLVNYWNRIGTVYEL